MEEEARLIVDNLENMNQSTIANQTFYQGDFKGKDLVLVQSGIGKVNAAVATSLLIDHFQADFVINSGSAGGIQEGMKVGDLVISTELAYHDADNRAFDYEYGQIPQMPHKYPVKESVASLTEKISQEQGWTTHKGLVLTGDSFVASSQELDRIKSYFPDGLVTEMEGAAVAQTCYQYGVNYLVIRAVSDVGDEEAGVSFDEFIVQAGKDSASLVLALVEELNG